MRHAVEVRIAYLIAWRGGAVTGPFKKMAAQATAWTAMGHEVGLFVTTSQPAAPDWEHLDAAVCVEVAGSGLRAGLLARRRTYRALRAWAPDVVYLRHGVYAPGLRRILTRFPTVLEVNGDEVTIARRTSAVKGIWAAATRSMTLSRAAGGVFMTNELATMPAVARHRFPRIVVANGIDLAATPPLAATTAASPRLVMLGHPRSPWHGTDKLLELARRHPSWGFDVIGPDESDLAGAAPANLTMHGELATEDYLRILASADIGLGTLAMHRLGASENPALKVREYLALGLAVILGCHDPDFPEPVDCILELPNTETNLHDHDGEIEQFVTEWTGRRVPRTDIAHLDLASKERRRIEFIARVARLSVPEPMTEQ
jgi:hypothetical protein